MGKNKVIPSVIPDTVYKFFGFNSESLDCLAANYLWCSKQEYLNDPFDFKPPFQLSGYGKADMKKYLKVVRALEGDEAVKDFKIKFPEWSAKPEILDEILPERLDILIEYTKNICVCCFTETYDNPAMLAHYCENFTGFIVEYETSRLAEKSDFIKVKYYPKGRELNLIDEFHGDSQFSLLASKRNEWAYESEYRLLLNPKDRQLGAGMKFDVNSGAYKKIIIPEQAPESVKRTLIAINHVFDPKIPVYECYADSAMEFKLRELPVGSLPIHALKP